VPIEPSILSACGGFLLAVLWMDLMFDVQALGHRGPALPERVLASIAAYYRRVTTTARPMGYLVSIVMLVAIVTLAAEIAGDPERRRLALASLPAGAGAIGLGIGHAFPRAVRLGARSDTPIEQSALARSICRDHLLCLVGIVALVALQLVAAMR
jgi:hypothetical protein